jgi:hypothetical protein
MGFFKFSQTQEEEDAPQKFDEFAEERFPTNDTKRTFKAGLEDIGQLAGGAIEYAGRKLNMPTVEDWARSQTKLSKAVTRNIESNMSEEGRKAVQAPVFASEEGEQTIFDDPARSIGLKSVRMVPMMLASAIPGTVLARVGLGVTGAAVGTGAVGSALGVGDVVNAVSDEIDGLSHEDLMKNSKVYRTEVEAGTDPAEARQTIKNIAQDEAAPLAALINFATNVIGPEAMLAKAMGGQVARKGIVRGVAEGLATGVPTEAIEGGTTAYLQEKAGEEYGGKDFSWFDIANQAAEEGLMGGVFGGVAGAATNVRRPKFGSKAGGAKAQPATPVETTQAAAPDASQQAALATQAGKPVARPTPPPTAPEAGTPPQGPSTVRTPGTETPPPGAKVELTRRRYKKDTTPPGGTVPTQVAPPVAPDPTQAAAVQASKPLVRKRAQAELAAAQAPQPPASAPPVPVAPTVEQPIAPPVIQPEAQIPAQVPAQVAPAPIPTPAPTPPIVLGKVAPTGRVLPDLAAQRRQQEELERQAAKPDEVAARGTRYQQTEASVLNPKEHQAWRRQMFREATKGENPSPIAIEATKIRAKPGIDLPEGMKERLRDLHTQWIAEQKSKPVQEKPAEQKAPKGQRGKIALPGGLVVKNAKQFVLEAARHAREEAGDAKARVQEFQDILRSAPNREDIDTELRSHPFVRAAAVFKEKLDNGTATEEDIKSFEKAEDGFVALSQEELDAQTRDIEAGIANKGGTGAVEISAETPTQEEASILKEEEEVTTKASKSGVVEEGSSGAASTVRRPQLSEEEKARLVALATPKGAAPIQERSREVPKAPGSIREPVAAKPELPKKVTKGEKLKTKNIEKEAKSKKEILDRIGRAILDLRESARKALDDGDRATAESLERDANNVAQRLKDNFGDEEHDKIMRTVEAVVAPVRNAPPKLTMEEIQKGLQKLRREREEKFRGHETVKGMDRFGRPNTRQARVVGKTTVGGGMRLMDFNQMTKAYTGSDTAGVQIANAINKNMVPKILNRTKDVPVYIISSEDWAEAFPHSKYAAAFYAPNEHTIYFQESEWNGNKQARDHVFLHEAVHAAFERSLVYTPGAEAMLQRIIDEARFNIISAAGRDAIRNLGVSYALTDPHEIVAEMFSNPEVQASLARVPVSKELAKELGLDSFQKYSLWSAVVAFVRRVIGLPKDTHSVLEAVMTVTNVSAGIKLNKMGDFPAADRMALEGENDPFFDDYINYTSNIDNNRAPQNVLRPILLSAVKQDVSDRVPRARGRSLVLNLATLHQLTQMADRYFPKGMAVKVSDTVEKIRLRRTQLTSAAQDKVVTRLHQLQKQYQGTDTFTKMEQIADRATSADIHPDVPLTHARNKHIKKTSRWYFARREHADLHKQWMALPDDLKQVWDDARTYLVEQQNTITRQHLNNIVEQVLGRKDEQLAQRMFNGNLSDLDKDLFRTNAMLRKINNARELKQIKGVYFPKMRRGRYVVTGRYKLPQWEKYKVTEKGKKVEDARYEFHDKQEYRDFVDDMRKRGITVTQTRSFTAEDNTNERSYMYRDSTGEWKMDERSGMPKRFPFSKGDTDTHDAWEVTVQDRLMEMHQSEREALQGARELKADGNYEVEGPVEHEKLNARTSLATSYQIKQVLGSMENSANWKKMSKEQRQVTEQAFLELSLSFVGSTAPQNRARPRRNVLGASKDLVRNVAEYSVASSGTIANLELRPELDKAFEDLHEYEKKYRGQTEDITLPRSQLLNKMEQNAYADDGTAPTKRNRMINMLLTLSFMDKLVSTGYHLVNMLQPWMVSAPVLGGRYGFAKATYELGRAYEHMGFRGTLLSGVKDTKRAMFDLLEGTTDYMADIRKKLEKQKDGEELADMLDYLHDRGLIDKDAGLEMSELISAGSKYEHMVHRVDHVVRQFGTAVEVVNRVTTAIAAYRMDRARGASIDDARVLAQEMVANTQGNYSMSNAPKIFKHPLGRTVLQFKKFAQLQYFLMSKLAYNAFKGATPQERIEAAAGLSAMLVAHIAMAGAVGLPTEPIKIPWMILSLFLDMPSWESMENQATEYATNFLGEDLGDAVAHGLPRLAGVDLSSRVGLNSLIMFGEPRKQEEQSVKAYLFDTVLGAPMGLGVEKIKGIRSLLDGDFSDAAEKLMPFKQLSDAVKAYSRAAEGKENERGELVEDPWGYGDAFVQALGFRPASQARAQEKRSMFFQQSKDRKAERQELLNQYVTGDRAAARVAILKWNAKQPKDARIKMDSLKTLLKRKASDKKKGYIKKGTYGGKLNKDLLEKYIGE